MIIKLWHKDETAQYAAEELKKYLDIMNPGFCEKIVFAENAEIQPEEGVIKLGLLDDFGFDTSDVRDYACDDVLYIDIKNGSGIIAGSNIRSILLSVYRYLRAAGCAFVRPGKDGEIIPKRDMASFSFNMRKKADYPFRGECVEGAVSLEHIRETVIWSPKVGMNMFMMEQIIPYNYMSRWYKHTTNTVKEDENVSFEEVGEMVREIEATIKKCGLQLHALGHGYLLEPYGIHYKTFDDKYELNDEARADIALVNGKRELFNGSPNFTHLCYSNKAIRKKLIDWLVSYMRKKPYIDFLHVWLADAINNQCECENCKDERVSDFYVMLLNELDEEFTRLGIDTRIVFILYVDTLWAPLHEKIKNPDRFYLMTAIGGREFTKPYDHTPYGKETPKYVKNNYHLEKSFPLRMQFIDDWKTAFDGRKLFFEYHMYVHQYNDPGYMTLSKLWLEDIKSLESFNVHGMMSDQTQRAFFPNGLPMSIYAEGMFDKSIEFDDFCEKYFKDSYGADYKLAYDYLSEISKLMGPDILETKFGIVDLDGDLGSTKKMKICPWIDNPEAPERFKKAMKLCDDFVSVAKAHSNEEELCHRKSWKLLEYHTAFCKGYADTLLTHGQEGSDKASQKLAELVDKFSPIEEEISTEFDLFLFDNAVKRRFK